MKGCILPFPKKGDLRLAKNYRGITLISIAAKIYNTASNPRLKTFLGRTKIVSGEIDLRPHKYWLSVEFSKGYGQKNQQATILFVDFTKAFDSIHRGKMEQILLEYGLPKETVATIIILYRNTKVKVRSPDGDTDYFDIVDGGTSWRHTCPIPVYNRSRLRAKSSIDKIKENGFELTKKRSRMYPAKTITDSNYADDIAILANSPAQAETQFHSLERAAAGIGLHVNAHKTEYKLL